MGALGLGAEGKRAAYQRLSKTLGDPVLRDRRGGPI